MRNRWRSGCARRGGRSSFSTVASARDGRAKRVLFIFMHSICSSLTAKKACFHCHWRRARTFSKSSAAARAIRFVIRARLAGTHKRLARRSEAARSRGNYRQTALTLFTNLDAEAARGSSLNASVNRNSSSADTLRRRGIANISAQFWLATMRTKSSFLPGKSALGSLQNRCRCSTRNSKRKRATIARLSIYHQSKMGNGCRTSHPQ